MPIQMANGCAFSKKILAKKPETLFHSAFIILTSAFLQ
jgi:hypothetical protein